MGNINVNDINQSSQATNYLNATECNGAFRLIMKLTTVADSSATVINHIITKDAMHTIHLSKTISILSDHYPIMYQISTSEAMRKTKKRVLFFSNRKLLNTQLFNDKMDKKLGELIHEQFPLTLNNFNKFFDQFVTEIKNVITKHDLLKHLSRKQQKLDNPGSQKES